MPIFRYECLSAKQHENLVISNDRRREIYFWAAIDKGGERTTMFESFILFSWGSIVCARPFHCPVLWSKKCPSSMTSRFTLNGTVLLTWTTRARRCIETEVAFFLYLACVVLCDALLCFIHELCLNWIETLVVCVYLCWERCTHVPVEVSAVPALVSCEDPTLGYADEFCIPWQVLAGPLFFLHSPFTAFESNISGRWRTFKTVPRDIEGPGIWFWWRTACSISSWNFYGRMEFLHCHKRWRCRNWSCLWTVMPAHGVTCSTSVSSCASRIGLRTSICILDTCPVHGVWRGHFVISKY